ncbi:acyltransferase [soil metagenome]
MGFQLSKAMLRRLKQAGNPKLSAGRLAWLDVAKGIGIILVVYGHQLRAQMAAGKVDPSWHAPLQDAMIYAFHMPLFFFISGLTIERTYRRVSGLQFLRTRFSTLLYPYVLWSLVSVALATVGHRYVQHQVSLGDALEIGWKPLFQYWFLYALFICQLLAFGGRFQHSIVIIIAAAALFSPFDMKYPIFVESAKSFPFFAAGILLSSSLQKSIDACHRRTMATGGLISVATFLGLFFGGGLVHFNLPFYNFVLASSGIGAVMALSAAVGRKRSLLALIGATSMAIFVLHTIVATAIRSALSSAPWLTPDILYLVLCVAAGIVIPIGIQRAVAAVGHQRLLGLGGPNPVSRD